MYLLWGKKVHILIWADSWFLPPKQRQTGGMGKETEWFRSCLQSGYWKIFALWHYHLVFLRISNFLWEFCGKEHEENDRYQQHIDCYRNNSSWTVSGKSPFLFRAACPFFCGGRALSVLWPGSSFLSFVDRVLSTRSQELQLVDVATVETV